MRTTMQWTRSTMVARSVASGAILAVLLAPIGSYLVAQEVEGGKGGDRRPLVIEKQGSFYYGYDTITAPGTFSFTEPFAPITTNEGDIFTIHQGYVFFQVPPNARRYPLVMVHGGGQTGKTYEDFEDRENY